MILSILYIKATMFVCLCGQCLEDSSNHCPFPRNNSFEHTKHGILNYLSFWPPGVCLHWGGSPKPRHGILKDMIVRTWDFSFGTYTVWVSKTQTWKFFKTWDPQFLETWSLHSGFPRPKKTWEILGYGF